MKKLSILMLSLMTLPAYSQSMLNILNQHQNSLTNSSEGSSSSSSSTPEVKPSGESISSSSTRCEETEQTSLPLAYVTSLIQQKNPQLDIVHYPGEGKVEIDTSNMIGNCSSMLEWKLKTPEIKGTKTYALEVKIKSGDDCKAEGCSYSVSKFENNEIKRQPMVFRPTLKGFEECLQKSGVIANGKVFKGAIVPPESLKESFTGLDQSGKLLVVSHGPMSPMIKAKYGKFEHQDGCDYYENAGPNGKSLLTLADATKERLDAEADKLRECKVDEYQKLADFIDKYNVYADDLGQIRDRLILEAAKKSAEAIGKGDYKDEDLKILADFERYVVNPKVDHARALYEEMLDLEGDAKKQKQAELKAVLGEISALAKKPYFLASHVNKLMDDGKFEEADQMNSFLLTVVNHQNLGSKIENVVITPGVASQRINAAKLAFASTIKDEKLRYEYKTGQSTGKAQEFANLAAQHREYIRVRNENWSAEIRLEAQRMQQPNGYCFKYWRNTQKCVQETQNRIQELIALLAHYNKVDGEIAAEHDAQSQYWSNLENQGRRYIAAQNGEEAPADVAPVVQPDTTRPTPRTQPTEDPGVYSFNFNAPQQQAQMTPQQYQYPITPYQNQNMFQQPSPYSYQPQQQYNNPWLGQQSYGMQPQAPFGYQPQGAYSFQWNGGGQQQYGQPGFPQQGNPQQPQYGYQQPQQAYGQYNMYGGVRW